MYTHILTSIVAAAIVAPACLAQDSQIALAGVIEQIASLNTRMTAACAAAKDAESGTKAIAEINKITADANALDKALAHVSHVSMPKTAEEAQALEDASKKAQDSDAPLTKALQGIPADARTPELNKAIAGYNAAMQKVIMDMRTASAGK